MRHKQFDFRTAYIDLLLNVLTGVIFLFILTTLMINPKKEDSGVKKDAQFIINAVWSPDVDCDVDLWVQDPTGEVVYFDRKEYNLMHIERDDLGIRNDLWIDSNGKVISQIKDNQETWVLRGVMPGEFYVSVHLYSCRYAGMNPLSALSMALNSKVDLPVKIELIKINPNVQTIVTENVVLQKIWDEATAFNFTLDASGNVTSFDRVEHRIVRNRTASP